MTASSDVENKALAAALLAGSGGGGKDSGGSARVAVEDPDTLQSVAYVRVLDLIGEGEIEGLVDGMKSVYLDDVPLQNPDGTMNFSGVTIDWRYGTQTQDYIPGFTSVSSTDQLSTRVTFGIPIVHQISNPDANACSVTVAVDSLAEQDTSNGDLHGSSVTMKLEYQPQNSGFIDAGTVVITGKTRSRYQRTVRIDLTGEGPWTVRISRLTQDSHSSALSNNTYVDYVTTIVDHRFRYPNSALVGIQIDARQFSNIPARSYLVKGLRIRVPTNYDPETRIYSGVWDGSFKIAWTDNPAWCFYDLLTSERYGLGRYVDVNQIDKASLYTIARYCDEMVDDGFGGLEPRFSMNCVLQTRAEAFKVMQDMATVFRGMTYWAGGTLVAVQDAPRQAVKKYTPANVINGVFTYSGSDRSNRHSVCTVRWNDPADRYRRGTEYVELPDALSRFGYRPTDIVAFGCTSRGQAHRVGLWLLWSEYVDTDQVSFQTGLEGATVLPGDIVMIADPLKAGPGNRYGGRVLSATTTSAKLDAPIKFRAGFSFFYYYVDSSGTDRSIGLINPGDVVTDTVQFTAPVPSNQIPATGDVWIVSGINYLEAATYRVIGVKETAKNIFEVNVVTHTPAKFPAIDSGTLLELPPTGLGDSLIALIPSNLAIFDTTYVMAPGLLGSKLVLTWSGNTTNYIIQWRPANGGWLSDTVSSPTYELLGVTEGISYDFRIYGVAANGQVSQAYETTYTVVGKTAPPGPCTALAAVGAYMQINLTWANPPDLDIAYIEILESAQNDPETATVVGRSTTQSFNRVGLNMGGKIKRYYWVRAVDTSRNIGPLNSNLGTEATTILISTSDFDGVIQTDQLAQDVISDIAGIVSGEMAGQITDLVASAIVDDVIGATADSTEITADSTQVFAGHRTLYSDVQETALATSMKLEQFAARVDENDAAIQQEITARADADSALASQITQVAAQTGVNRASIEEEITARTDADSALAQTITTVNARVDENVAAIQNEVTARATADSALSQTISTVSATVGNNSAAIQIQSTALVNLQGAAEATYTIKAQTYVDGRVYAAGMGLGVYNSPSGIQTSVYFLADRFALLNLANGVATTPFIIDAGITYIRSAMIQDASITTAKIVDASITAAKIANAQIVNAHIVNAQIDRLKIAGQSATTSAAFDFGYWSGQQWDGNWRDRGYGSITIPESAQLMVVIQNSFDDGFTLNIPTAQYGPNKRNFDFRIVLNGGAYGTAEVPRQSAPVYQYNPAGEGGTDQIDLVSYNIVPVSDWSFCFMAFNVAGPIAVTLQYRLRQETAEARTINSNTRMFLLSAYR